MWHLNRLDTNNALVTLPQIRFLDTLDILVETMKTLGVAVAQMACVDGQVDVNLNHASQLTLESAQKGAELVLFPEFMSQGYRLTTEIWNSAEPFDGPTTRWLCAAARKSNVFVGSSFLEANQGHFLNTFTMASPSGRIIGVVRKRYPSMWEAYFFKGSPGQHTFETDFGRVGVGICFDSHTHTVASILAASSPVLILMPHSYCTPTIPDKKVSQADIDRLNMLPGQVAHLYNNLFNVPVLMCNKTGSWDSPVPNKILGTPKGFSFSGRSTILDSDGTTIVELGNQESVGFGQVKLNPELKKKSSIPRHGRYIYPGPIGRKIIRFIEWRGSVSYAFNKYRKQKALSAEQNLR
jgi:N-carbamoylputrescine amidase